MHITFVNSLYPPYGAAGAETSLALLASDLRSRGHRCTIVTLSPERKGRCGEVDNIPVHYIPLANVYWPFGDRRPRPLRPVFQAVDAYDPAMGRRLSGLLSSLRPDVLHCHNLKGFSVSAWVAAHRLRIPVVQTLHDYYLACPRSAMWRPARGNCRTQCPECWIFSQPRRRLSHLPHAVTSVSRRVLERVTAARVFAGTEHVRVIRGNNGRIVPPPHRAAGAPAAGALRLGFLGRLDPAKGLEALLDAVAALPASAVTLQVAGRGDEGYQRALRARAGRRGNVSFLGHVAPGAFFPGIDLLVIPSVWEDPFPRVFHEALAYGVPSLVSPLGGLPEVIQPGITGFVASGASAEGLRAGLEALLRPGAWHGDAMRAILRAAASAYAPELITSQYEAVLSAAAQGAAPPADAGEVWAPRQAGAAP